VVVLAQILLDQPLAESIIPVKECLKQLLWPGPLNVITDKVLNRKDTSFDVLPSVSKVMRSDVFLLMVS
jgi:hypothetical protein